MSRHGRWASAPNRAYLAPGDAHGAHDLNLPYALRRPLWDDNPGGQAMAFFANANVVGALVVFSYLALAGQGGAHAAMEQLSWGPTLLAGYGLLVGALSLPFGARVLRSLDWWYEKRAPSEQERVATLLLPRGFVRFSAAAWAGGNIVFAVANTLNGNTAREILRSIIGTALGGATTCAACYLLSERALRPVFAVVLRDGLIPVRSLGVRQRILLAWALGSGIPLLAIAFATVGPDHPSVADLASLGVIGLVFGGTLISVATRSVSDRLASVQEALARIEGGDLSVEVAVDEAGQIGQLQAGVNAMVHGLQERRIIADLFGRHVGEDVAKQALEAGVHLGGEQRDVSVLFLDVTGSTLLAATRPAPEVVAWLNELFTIVVRVVGEEGGWVDKFEGDAALCVFGAPGVLEDHPTKALRAARRLREVVVPLEFGIGVSSGVVVAGNIGSEARFEYTVIGDPVNEASRLTEAAKTRPSHVLAAERTVVRADSSEACSWAAAETILLRGRPEATPTFEPRSSTVDDALAWTLRSGA